MLNTPTLRSLVVGLTLGAACATVPRAGAAPPTDVQWRLTELESTPARPSGGRDASLQFGADGRVTGFTTCNSLFGSYTAPGDGRLRFMGLGSTKRACVDPLLAAQEQRFMNALQRVERFVVVSDTLILRAGAQSVARLVAVR